MTIHIGQNASLTYTEGIYHRLTGGIDVRPVSMIIIEEGGQFFSNFVPTPGGIGALHIDYVVAVGKAAVAELVTKAFGSSDDRVNVFFNGCKWILEGGSDGLSMASKNVPFPE